MRVCGCFPVCSRYSTFHYLWLVRYLFPFKMCMPFLCYWNIPGVRTLLLPGKICNGRFAHVTNTHFTLVKFGSYHQLSPFFPPPPSMLPRKLSWALVALAAPRLVRTRPFAHENSLVAFISFLTSCLVAFLLCKM